MGKFKGILREFFKGFGAKGGLTTAPVPGIQTFSEGQDRARQDCFSKEKSPDEQDIAWEHMMALACVGYNLDQNRKAVPLEGISPIALMWDCTFLSRFLEVGKNGRDDQEPSRILADYSFLGLVSLLGKAREAYTHFSGTPEADHIDDFDLIQFREELGEVDPSKDLTKPDPYIDGIIKVYGEMPARLAFKRIVSEENEMYLNVINGTRQVLNDPVFAGLLRNPRRIDSRYIPEGYLDKIESIISREHLNGRPGSAPSPQ